MHGTVSSVGAHPVYLNPDNQNQTPLPAFDAYRFAAQKLGLACLLRQLQEYPGRTTYLGI